jgi:hypothetical protein
VHEKVVKKDEPAVGLGYQTPNYRRLKMNYNINPEMINGLAQQFAEIIKFAVNEQQKADGGTPNIAQIEANMRETLRLIGQQALGYFLRSMQTTPVSEISCTCGGTLHYQRMREALVISVFGKTTYERAYYSGCACKKGKAPLDEQFGLVPGAVTAGLAALLSLAGIEFSYDESSKWLNAYLLFDVSENTVRSETEKMGALQAQQEKQLIERSQEDVYLQQRQCHPAQVPARLYGSMDAAKVRIEPRPKKGEAKEKHEDWRDMKVLCWYEVESVPTAQHSSRHREKIVREQPALRAKNMHYFCDITEAEKFGELLWATGCSHKADLSPELIFLGDGAVWIWNLVAKYYPKAIQIVDWFHAEEHLEMVANAAFPPGEARNNWLEGVKQALWEGQVEEVISNCEALAASCEVARKAVHYFYTNAERMRYDSFRAAGYMIGSGTVESGCKQIVTHRLKLPGAQWTVNGAIQTAKARAVWLSGHWQSLCDQRAALPLVI